MVIRVIVEVVGPPGSGKTTVSRRLVERLTAQGKGFRYVNLARREGALWRHRLLAAVCNPRLVLALSTTLPPGGGSKALSRAFDLLRRDFKQRRLSGDVIVDSGPLFATATIVLNFGVPAARLVPFVAEAHVVVRLLVPPHEAVTRLRARAEGYFGADTTAQSALRHVRQYDAAISEVIAIVKAPVVPIDVRGLSVTEAAESVMVATFPS